MAEEESPIPKLTVRDVEDWTTEQRRLLAESVVPLPQDVLYALATDEDDGVRYALTMSARPLTDVVVRQLASDPFDEDTYMRALWRLARDLPPEEMEEWANTAEAARRSAVLLFRDVPASVIATLSYDADEAVAGSLIEWPGLLDDDVVRHLARFGSWVLSSLASSDRELPPDVMARLASGDGFSGPALQYALAASARPLPGAMLETFLESDFPRLAELAKLRLSKPLGGGMYGPRYDPPNGYYPTGTWATSIDDETAMMLATDDDWSVRFDLAISDTPLPAEVVRILANDPIWFVREALDDSARSIPDDVAGQRHREVALRRASSPFTSVRRKLAQSSWELPDDVQRLLASDRDVVVRRRLAASAPVLNPEVALRLASDDDATVRAKIASGIVPLPAEVIERLVHDEDLKVREGLARGKRDLTPDICKELVDSDFYSRERIGVALVMRSGELPDEAVRTLLYRNDAVRLALIRSNRPLATADLEMLAEHWTVEVRLALAQARANLPYRALLALARDDEPAIQQLILSGDVHPLSDELLVELVDSSAPNVLKAVATWVPRIPAEVCRRLAWSEDLEVRTLLAARDDAMPADVVRHLLDDDERQVRWTLAANSTSLPDDVARKLRADPDEWLRLDATDSTRYLPTEVVRQISTHPDPFVRATLAASDRPLPQDVVTALARDDEPRVREALLRSIR